MKRLMSFAAALVLVATLCVPALASAYPAGDGAYTVKYSKGVVAGNQYLLLVAAGDDASWSSDDADILYAARQTAGEGGLSFSFTPARSENAVALLYGDFSDGSASPVVAGVLEAPLHFDDVADGDWFSDYVYAAAGMGLIGGMGAKTYAPGESMTWAQAVKLAACMNQLYGDGAVTLQNGTVNWYDTYMDYCLEKGILRSAPADPDAMVTRAEYAVLFAACLPEAALPELNYVAYNAIPDVPITAPCAEAVYALYRAGILKGTDDAYSFSPDTEIRRSEVAAVIVRMMDKESRVTFTLA